MNNLSNLVVNFGIMVTQFADNVDYKKSVGILKHHRVKLK